MIIDTLAQASRYHSLDPLVAQGLDWLTRFDPATPDGRYDLDGDKLYALVQSYDTAAPDQKKYESHRRYLDIQYVAAGKETMYYAPTSGLIATTDYHPEKDYLLYADPAQATVLDFSPGSFAIYYPPDGHKPGCISVAQQRVKKVVIKALV